MLHTNERHPFLTVEKGFLPVSQLRLGMHIVRANGGVGVVTNEQVAPGVQTMYNLEVAQDHTYTVGAGQWVVHNCGGGLPENATFAQKTYGKVFGQRGPFAKQSLDGVIKALGDGTLKAEDLPVQYIRRAGGNLILNTRSTVSLIVAGIDRSEWRTVDVTGNAFSENALNNQLARNDLTEAGIDFVTGHLGEIRLP